MVGQGGADRLAAAGDQGQQVRVQTGLVIEAHGFGGDQRRLLGGLGHDGVAGGERSGDLAGEDGQREVPRADGGEDAAAVQDQFIGLAGRALQGLAAAEVALGQLGVVAAEVGGFAHLGDAVVQRLARFTRQQGDQAVQIGFQSVGHGAQDGGAARAAQAVPGDLGLGGGVDGGVDVLGRGFRHMAQHARAVIGVGDVLSVHPSAQLAADDRAGGQLLAVDALQSRRMALAVGSLRIVAAEGVLAVTVDVHGHRDLRMAVGLGLDRGDGIGGHVGRRHALVQQGVDEGGVGAVFQQAAHQIGQQFLMAADGGVGADDDVAPLGPSAVIEGLAHAVQALELDGHAAIGGHAVHGGQGVGVVGGELGEDVGRGLDQRLGADQIVQIGRRLGREDRIVGAAVDLGQLDLGVPIGALDQTHHQATTRGLGQFGQLGHRLGRALLIGLNGQAQTLPVAQRRFARQPLQQLQRQGQTVGLFGVDGVVDVVFGGDQRQTQDAGIQLFPHPILLHRLIARRQGRQLDRDAVAALGAFALGGLAHGLDGVGVDLFIAFGVGGGAGALAQHVEAAQPVFAVRPLKRALDGAADDELLAHDLDGGGDSLADDRLAQAAGDALQEARQVAARLVVNVDQLAGQHQTPGRGVDEQAVRLTHVAGPVGRADLLGDQTVAGARVRRAQQGLGQAHQRQAFTRAQAELLQEAFDHALTLLALAGAFD